MKIGDLVTMKGDDVLGMIVGLNTDAEPSFGSCWHVFWFQYGRRLPSWESELEMVNESR
jgi:hypothetical protein